MLKNNGSEYDIIHDNTNTIISHEKPVLNMVHYFMHMEAKHWGKSSYLDVPAKVALNLLGRLELKVLNRSRFIMMPSRYAATTLKPLLKKDKDIIINNYGIDTDLFCPASRIQKKYDLLFVGRIVPRKGIRIFCETLEKISHRRLNVMICAIKSRLWPYLVRYAKRSRHHITINTDVAYSRLPGYYNEAHITVFPSSYETFGMVSGESLASGTPVVAFNIAANPEIIVNGKTGILVDKYNAGVLANTISELLNDKDSLKRMGDAGREYVLNKFRWENNVAKTYECYERLLF